MIFISIDDNEQANLKLLCDEVFGEINVDIIIWRKSGDGRDGKMKNTTTFRKDHEYIIVCYKQEKKLNKIIEKPEFKSEPQNPDNDKRGSWLSGSISRADYDSNPEHQFFYTVISPARKEISRQFEISKQEFDILNKDNRISWGKKGDSIPRLKIFCNETRRITPYSVFLAKGTTTEGTKEANEILQIDCKSIRPKPTQLIKTISQLATNKDDIILDFFAGSGTTGEAVMKLNAEDGGNRKYVLVQLDEPIKEKNNKEAYDFVKNELKKEPTIFEIAAERLRRAGAKIEQTQQEKPQELAQEKSTLDTGFKIFALAKDKNNEIHRIKHSEQKQLPTKLPKITIQNETLLYNMLLGAGIPFQEKIHCLIKNTCYQAKEHLFILQQFSLGKKNEASKENEAILEKASAEYAHIYNRNITDDEFILNLTKFIKKEKITLKEPL